MSFTSGLSFDLETYIGRYPAQSETRLQRLFFIYHKAHDSNDKELSTQAKNLAVEQIRSTGNIKRYKELLSLYPDEQDQEWILQTTRESQVVLKTLLGSLSTAQAHLNKEAIRLAYLALCDFHRPRGEIEEAMRVALRSREYCTTRNQTAHVCLLIMELAMDIRNLPLVQDYVTKAGHSIISGDPSFPIKLKAASGLAYLANGDFRLAAKALTTLGVVEEWGNLCSPEDVALYGGLVGLATLPRSVLLTVLDSPSMELVPRIRECLGMYCRADYCGSMDILSEIRPLLELDMHLAPRLTQLMLEIRNKALVDYLKPYKRVSLPTMAAAFSMECSDLITTLATLIGNKHIQGSRINCATQTLEKDPPPNVQLETQRQVTAMQDRILNDSHACVIRLACIELDLSVDQGRVQPHQVGLDLHHFGRTDSSDDDERMEPVMVNSEGFY